MYPERAKHLHFRLIFEKENLCLYGHPNESWEVTMPADEVPLEIPEPALGINFSRDGMLKKNWISLVAVQVIVGWSLWLSTLVLGPIAMKDQEMSTTFWGILGELDQHMPVIVAKPPARLTSPLMALWV